MKNFHEDECMQVETLNKYPHVVCRYSVVEYGHKQSTFPMLFQIQKVYDARKLIKRNSSDLRTLETQVMLIAHPQWLEQKRTKKPPESKNKENAQRMIIKLSLWYVERMNDDAVDADKRLSRVTQLY